MKRFLKWLLRPIWSRFATRIDIRIAPLKAEIDSFSQELNERLSNVELHTNHVPALEGRLAALEAGWRRHVPALLNAASSVAAFGYELVSLREQMSESSGATSKVAQGKANVNREIDALQSAGILDRGECTLRPTEQARLVAPEKLFEARAKGLRVNLGCGHAPLANYINVDQQKFPGVDIIGDVGDLPFEEGSVQEFFSSHMLEHFPQERLRWLLSYWKALLAPSGLFCAIVSDGEAMLAGVANGSYSFEHLREALFGGPCQTDFHVNLLTPGRLTILLSEAGFRNIEVPVKARRNGVCFEFEIRAVLGPAQGPESIND